MNSGKTCIAEYGEKAGMIEAEVRESGIGFHCFRFEIYDLLKMCAWKPVRSSCSDPALWSIFTLTSFPVGVIFTKSKYSLIHWLVDNTKPFARMGRKAYRVS